MSDIGLFEPLDWSGFFCADNKAYKFLNDICEKFNIVMHVSKPAALGLIMQQLFLLLNGSMVMVTLQRI